MQIPDKIKAKREDILEVAARHGASNVGLFGSHLRGTATELSDVDFLVKMQAGRSPIELINLCDDLETILERRVDVLTDAGISPSMKDEIISEAAPL